MDRSESETKFGHGQINGRDGKKLCGVFQLRSWEVHGRHRQVIFHRLDQKAATAPIWLSDPFPQRDFMQGQSFSLSHFAQCGKEPLSANHLPIPVRARVMYTALYCPRLSIRKPLSQAEELLLPFRNRHLSFVSSQLAKHRSKQNLLIDGAVKLILLIFMVGRRVRF